MKRFGSFKGLNTIELGAGSGTNSLLFAKRGADVTVLDYSKKALERSKEFFRRNNTRANFVLCDALNLDKSLLNKYDVAMSFGTGEHFEGNNRIKIIKSHFDVLKKGGLTLICLPNRANLPYMVWKFLSQATGRWRWGVEIPFSRNELKRIMALLGREGYFMGDCIFSSFEVLNPWKIVRRILRIGDRWDLNKIKKQRGTFLDEYFSPYITLIGKG